MDLLGHGTACLSGRRRCPVIATAVALRRPDGRPEAAPAQYGPSTTSARRPRSSTRPRPKFYLADKAAGKPWVTRLPFPVHVVEAGGDLRLHQPQPVRHALHVSSRLLRRRSSASSAASAVVDQLDTEEFGALTRPARFPPDATMTRLERAAVLTKTWFHTGVFLGQRPCLAPSRARVLPRAGASHLREPDPLAAMLLDDTILPDLLTPRKPAKPAGLKGSMLRQEVYALDGTEESGRPYTVAESNSTDQPLQPRLQPARRLLHPPPRDRDVPLRAEALRHRRRQARRPARQPQRDAGGRRLRQRPQVRRDRLRPPLRGPLAALDRRDRAKQQQSC